MGLSRLLWHGYVALLHIFHELVFLISVVTHLFFIYKQGTDTAYLLLSVDDIVLTASFEVLLYRIITSLHQEFSMTDLGSLNYFLGFLVMHNSLGMFLSRCKYVTEILERAHMVLCNPCRKPNDTESKLGDNVIFILYYMVAYSDADWTSCPTTRRSTSGYCVFLSNNLLSSSSKHQLTLSPSRVEAEYHGVANVVAETCWLRNLLCELHTPLSSVNLAYCDNVSVLYLLSNTFHHQRTKHIKIDIHSVRDLVVVG
ncbi:ribonuclease H-like domain-containing protein [Tanacetum coccineum]